MQFWPNFTLCNPTLEISFDLLKWYVLYYKMSKQPQKRGRGGGGGGGKWVQGGRSNCKFPANLDRVLSDGAFSDLVISSGSGKTTFFIKCKNISTFKEERTSIVKYPLLNFDKDIIPPIPSLLFLSKVKHENLSRLWNWQLAWEMMCCVSQEFSADKQISQEWKYGDMSRKFSVFLASNVYSNSRCTKNFRMNIFLLFLLLFFRSAELWAHSSTAVGVAGYILSSARAARPPEYPSPTRRGCT